MSLRSSKYIYVSSKHRRLTRFDSSQALLELVWVSLPCVHALVILESDIISRIFRFFFINCIILFNGYQVFMRGNWNTTDFIVA